MSLSTLWSHAMDSVHWHACTIHSHAAALVLFYLFCRVPFNFERKRALRKSKPSSEEMSSAKRRGIKSTKTSREAPPSPIGSTFSDTDIDDSDQEELDMDDREIERACPKATAKERQRFLTARQGDVPGAIRTLSDYVEWVTKHEKISSLHNIKRKCTDDPDHDIWAVACAVAIKACDENCDVVLPRVIRTHQINRCSATDLQGHRIFHIIPALMDDKLAKTSTYALATALYINKQLDREGLERITVCMDVRAGKGWPNIHAIRLVPFMKQTTTLLLSLFPERLHKCVLYPVPPSFLWIWNMISKVIDPRTEDKICLLSGVNKIVAPPPLDQMCEHMDKDVALMLESYRVGTFRE